MTMSIIASGKVSITKAINEQKVSLSTLEIGDFFGEISLIQSRPTTATVTAKEYCALLRLSQSKFKSFIQSLPESQKKLINDSIVKRLAKQH